MGMFDYVIVPLSKLPINDKEMADLNSEPFQTKCFDCVMTEIYITEDGKLTQNNWKYEAVPKEERPYPNDEGLLGLCGSLKRVNERIEAIPFHGVFNFYHIGHSGKWYEFKAKFTDGQLVDITRVKEDE
jgi:hypothetical protein